MSSSEEGFLDIIEALNNALYIGKYITKYEGDYKKDKKRVNKLLEETEKGNFYKYRKGYDGIDEDE